MQTENYLLAQVSALAEGDVPLLSLLSNVAAALWENLPRLNWAGFYLKKGDALYVGPFQGKVACVRIPIGKGVCGTAAREKATQLVPDVHAFPGHIACDSASNSELVVPILTGGEAVAVIDLDSPDLNRFTAQDARLVEQVAALLAGQDWQNLL